MFSNLSYEQKLKVVGIGLLLLVVLSYPIAINKTLHEYNTYKKQSDAGFTSHPAGYSEQLAKQRNDLNHAFEQFVLDTLNPQKNLLAIVGNYCNDHEIRFKEYKPMGIKKEGALSTMTRSIVVEGSFLSCLRLIYELETRQKAGRVSSVRFKSYADARSKQTKLTCTLFIQNILSDHEKK